ncbi:hypothetical protein BRN95_02220 [Xanthomonas oryzae pv. oryzae]|nr:hypothetical protein BRN95_02220 [Xanthomonas oryzae pv. oryzae]
MHGAGPQKLRSRAVMPHGELQCRHLLRPNACGEVRHLSHPAFAAADKAVAIRRDVHGSQAISTPPQSSATRVANVQRAGDFPSAHLLRAQEQLTEPARLHKLADRAYLVSACLSWNTLIPSFI